MSLHPPKSRAGHASDGLLQRADGAARLGVTGDGTRRPRLSELYQKSPCRILFPHVDDPRAMEAVLVNTAGGLAGGDRISQSVTVGDRATVTVTTQAAEKCYRALDSQARVTSTLRTRDAALLEWLPQETILFDRSRLSRTTEVHVGGEARVLAMEWTILGRSAFGETVREGAFHDNWRIWRNGRLTWSDAFRLVGPIDSLVQRPSLLAGRKALATVICAAPDAPHLHEVARGAVEERLRPMAPNLLAATTLVGGVMVCRLLAFAAEDLRRAVALLLAPLREALHGHAVPLPAVWRC